MTDSSSHSDTGTLLAANLSGTPGITLRLAREKEGLTLAEMAARTKIPVSVLEAIEHDDTAKLGQPVYVRGYLRKYAAALNIPESRVLGAFDSRQAARPAAEIPREEVAPVEEEGRSNPMLWILLIVIFAAIAGAAVLYFKSGSLSAITRRLPAAVRPAPVRRAPVRNPAPAPAPAAVQPQPEPQAIPAPASQSAPAGVKSTAPASENSAVPGGPPPVNQPEPGPVSPPPAPR